MWWSTLTPCPVCKQLRVKTPITLLFAISWTCSGHWVTRAQVFVSAGYQATNEKVDHIAKETLAQDIDPLLSVHYTDMTGCHHCGQTLTIDHMLLECALLQVCRDENYTVNSFNVLFETIPETCIVEFLREAGFFYLIWCNLSTSPQTFTIWSDLSNYLENKSNSETHLFV